MHDIITVKNAKLKTVTVTIDSLTVNGRQVTLAIYRQLIEEDLINWATGELNGLPWGTVNYHPHCGVEGSHLHVVWQRGDQLRRAAELTYFREPEFIQCIAADWYAKLLMREIALGRRGDELQHKRSHYRHYSFIKNGQQVEAELNLDVDKDIVESFDYLTSERLRSPHFRKERNKAKKFFRDMPGDLVEVGRNLDAAIKKEIKRRKQIRASIEEIKKLPQLFIAV